MLCLFSRLAPAPNDCASDEVFGLCCAKARATAGGVCIPAGSERPRALMTRMVKRPERGIGAPSDEASRLDDEEEALASVPGLAGVGVAERSSGVRAPKLAPSLNSARGRESKSESKAVLARKQGNWGDTYSFQASRTWCWRVGGRPGSDADMDTKATGCARSNGTKASEHEVIDWKAGKETSELVWY